MKQLAVVKSIDGKFVTVEAERTAMCDGCHAKGCGDCSMYKIFGGNKKIQAVAVNVANAAVGDTVIIEVSDTTVNISAFFVFLLPLIIGFAAYFSVRSFFGESLSVLAAFVCFALYFVFLSVIESRRKSSMPKLKVTSVKASKSDYTNDNIDKESI